MSKNSDGILLISSSSNYISDNIIGINGDGITLGPYSLLSPPYCYHNIISNNAIISNYDDGIYLWRAYYNTIEENDIISSIDNGIFIRNSSDNSIIKNTIKMNNAEGIYLYNNSYNNHIFYNIFKENLQNAFDECSNNWDDGRYGNYWDDYEERYPNARKKPFRGTWDTPYEIPGGNNKDRYPLINSDSFNTPKSRYFCLLQFLFKFFKYSLLYCIGYPGE